MVGFDMSWEDAIRLGVELLRMAKVCRVEMPAGIEVPLGGLILVTPEHEGVQRPSKDETEVNPLDLINAAQTRGPSRCCWPSRTASRAAARLGQMRWRLGIARRLQCHDGRFSIAASRANSSDV